MKSKMTLFIAVIFLVTIFAFGLSIIPKSIGQVEAGGMVGMGNMMRSHHGANWQQHHNSIHNTMMQNQDQQF